MNIRISRLSIFASLLFCIALAFSPASLAQSKPIRIGLVTFLSGPAATSLGIPARLAAEAIVGSLNSGGAPTPYTARGFGGRKLELVFIDEAGGAARQVAVLRAIVARKQVDFVVGYTGDGNCLAVAPVAEELRIITVLLDCGTPRIFEEASYRYVFRPRSHSTMDAVAGALYLSENRPGLKSLAGINQNYPWGRESWADFSAAMLSLNPDLTITTTQWAKFGSGNYAGEIESLGKSDSDVIFSSFWGDDLEAFMPQAMAKNLFSRSQLMLVAGEAHLGRLADSIPEGSIVGARGTNGVFAPRSALQDWLRQIYFESARDVPNYPAYSMAQALLGLKSAYEKATEQIAPGTRQRNPGTDAIIAAFEYQSFDTPSGRVVMKLGRGHQAVTGTAYGTARTVNGRITIGNIKHYSAERVQPPEGVKSRDWINAGMNPGGWLSPRPGARQPTGDAIE